MLSELACLWCTDGCVLKVCWAVELAALEGTLCALEETSCCSLRASLHSAESKLLFQTNTCKVKIVIQVTALLRYTNNNSVLFPFLLYSYFCDHYYT